MLLEFLQFFRIFHARRELRFRSVEPATAPRTSPQPVVFGEYLLSGQGTVICAIEFLNQPMLLRMRLDDGGQISVRVTEHQQVDLDRFYDGPSKFSPGPRKRFLVTDMPVWYWLPEQVQGRWRDFKMQLVLADMMNVRRASGESKYFSTRDTVPVVVSVDWANNFWTVYVSGVGLFGGVKEV